MTTSGLVFGNRHSLVLKEFALFHHGRDYTISKSGFKFVGSFKILILQKVKLLICSMSLGWLTPTGQETNQGIRLAGLQFL